ncbi:MAG: quinol:electron acceptor oxidoreductase subunit ActD [Planctomycetota bacterium]
MSSSGGLLEGRHEAGALTARLLDVPQASARPGWWLAVGVCLLLTILLLGSVATLFAFGVGLWGIKVPVAWGLAITNFVWWIGIGHAGTLISAVLLLFRQRWRNSINRFAEAMTLFAVLNAALFPLLHLGRPNVFYYMLPYPNRLGLWPQWGSPLVWDAFAVMTYGLVSLLFWYLGLIPDLASVRDRAASRGWVRRLAALGALGWRGTGEHWRTHQTLYLLLAGLATPLVVSVHSIVAVDFARALVPGWHSTVFPPYFVAGAIYSGLAMLVTILVPFRAIFGLRDLITARHLDALGKLMLASGTLVAYGYGIELFAAWKGGEAVEVTQAAYRLGGEIAPLYWATLICNVLVAQALWIPAVRRRPRRLFAVACAVNVGMWLERYVIVTGSLSRGFLPASWDGYLPTAWDWALFAGTLGLFGLLLLLFVRLLPSVSIYELKELGREEGALELEPAAGERPPPPAAAGSGRVLAAFSEPARLLEAIRALRAEGRALVSFTPWPVRGLSQALELGPSRLPWVMLAAAAGGALLGYLGLQVASSVWLFPQDVGGRPLHSWARFLPVTFECAVLCAALAGCLGFLRSAGLPRLHHPDFELPAVERATHDRLLLLVEPGELAPLAPGRLEDLGALWAREVDA